MKELTIREEIQEHKVDWTMCLDNFLRAQSGKSYKTITSYRAGVRAFLRYMEEQGITDPLPDDIHDFIADLRKNDYSIFSINLYMISLKKFFAYLDQPYKDTNLKVYPDIYKAADPKTQSPKRRKHYRDKPSDEEVHALRFLLRGRLDQKSIRDLLIIDLALCGGLRVNEIGNLKKTDLVKDGDDFKLFLLRKGETRKTNFIWLDKNIAERLEQYARNYLVKDYVFYDISRKATGGHLTSSSISTIISSYMRAAKIKREGLTPHSLRHYAGTKLWEETHDIYLVQQFFGHSDLETSRIYMHTDDAYEKSRYTLAPVS